ncbi:MAG: ABC transporter permease [Bacillota bacterium]
MLINLIGKELKQQLKNISIYLLAAIILLFYFTQFAPPSGDASLEPVLDPQRQNQYFGSIEITDPVEEMRAIYMHMYMDYLTGIILKQGFMLNRDVKLNEKQLQSIDSTMDAIYPEGISQFSREELLSMSEGKQKPGIDFEGFTPAIGYEEYKELLKKLDKELGGNTYYSEKNIDALKRRPMTYAEAVEEFEKLKEKDKLTGAYGRVFADYMGVVAGFFPIFIAAFLLTRDRRSNMYELIYSRRVSSLSYVFSKYVALLITTLVLFLIPATHATYSFAQVAAVKGYTIDVMAFYKYTIVWILPTLMFTIASGMLSSIVFGNGIVSIVIQFILWVFSMLPLVGDYGLGKMVIRFNELGLYDSYMKWLPSITVNRIFYMCMSLLLTGAAAWVLSRKRGAVNGASRFSPLRLLQRKAAA